MVSYSKFKAKKTTVDGITFASKKESAYYQELKLRKRAEDIKDFTLQPEYELLPAFTKDGRKHRGIIYVADFLVIHNDGTQEVIDVKGFETKVFKIKRKLFDSKYPDLKLTLAR